MKTLLLLGGFGFIGTNLIKYIDENLKDTYRVIVFDKISEHPHGIKFDSVSHIYSGDFSDETYLTQIFAENQVDFVIHLLSSTVPATSNNAQYDIETNLIPTLKLLSIMARYSVKDIVYMSSGGAIYGDVLQKVHSEEDAVYPKSSYGIVKLAIEKYLLSYSELYGFHTLIFRLSNPFGPYHYSNKQGVINVAIRKALSGEPFQIWGNGNGVKDYIFIKDACDAMMRIIGNGIESDVLNLAASNALSVNDIYNAIRKDIPSFTVQYVEASSIDVESFELDITKLRSKLGVFKITPFSDALKYTIEWQKSIL